MAMREPSKAAMAAAKEIDSRWYVCGGGGVSTFAEIIDRHMQPYIVELKSERNNRQQRLEAAQTEIVNLRAEIERLREDVGKADNKGLRVEGEMREEIEQLKARMARALARYDVDDKGGFNTRPETAWAMAADLREGE